MTTTTPLPELKPQPPAPRLPPLLPWGRVLAAAGAVAVGLVLFEGLGSQADEVAAPGNDAPVVEGDVIRFSPEFAKRAGITTAPVTVERLEPLVTAHGAVTFDPRRFAAVGARITGRVRQLDAVVGDQVKAGQVLAELESAELGRAEAGVLSARAREKAAEADFKRERRLADAHISPERDAEAAAATYAAARADRVAAEKTVEALGGDFDARLGVLVLRSPIDGRVVASRASRGQTLEPSHTVLEVADLRVVWVNLQVYERDLGAIRVGDAVELTAQSGGGARLEGRVDHVGDLIDPETHTAPVRVVVPNEPIALRPGQSVTARIHTSGPAAHALSVPSSAVTRVDGKPTVFLARGEGTVEPRPIVTHAEDGVRVGVSEGLKEGDRVVLGGLFALKSEIYR
ncbi:MAG: efflux RND transporter periplasmic adaptor subunit [Myxococcaceae bacterium]|nr:efflux RND transporter periplasmic adaptor subunit [Myxococcaceae bacterium]